MVEASANQGATAILALADGSVFFGRGAGATGEAAGELCFNTAMTGQQEILTDPSYTGQIVCFTFPHVGNVGANPDDMETGRKDAALGAVMRADITRAANWRAAQDFDDWMESRGIVGVTGVDTRAITKRIRENGMPHAIVAHDPDGKFDVPALIEKAKAFAGLEGADLASAVTTEESYGSTEARWDWPDGFPQTADDALHVVVMDFGTKKNILRSLGASGLKATVVPAKTTADEILALKPDGVMLSNGPGDPEPCTYAIAAARELIARKVPTFGICLGHQILGLAAGAKTVKMQFGHHGAHHPVQDLDSGKVMITSQNHGFAVDDATLPANVRATHRSLFDGSLQGIALTDAPAFSFQGHPEASPGPHDVAALFDRFIDLMTSRSSAN